MSRGSDVQPEEALPVIFRISAAFSGKLKITLKLLSKGSVFKWTGLGVETTLSDSPFLFASVSSASHRTKQVLWGRVLMVFLDQK